LPNQIKVLDFKKSPEMNIKNSYSDADGQRDQDHSEEEVLAQQGNCQRRRRNDFGQQQEKHGQREQYGNAQSYLEFNIF
jgi:hypothetical protein